MTRSVTFSSVSISCFQWRTPVLLLALAALTTGCRARAPLVPAEAPAEGAGAEAGALTRVPIQASAEANLRLLDIGVGTLLAQEDGDPARTTLTAYDTRGQTLWTSESPCPDSSALSDRLFMAGDTLICKSSELIVGLSPADGSRRWENPTGERFYITAPVGDRLVVSVNNTEVQVWQSSTGEVLRRIAVPDIPLEAAAQTPDGPMAFLVGDGLEGAAHSLVAISVDGKSTEVEALEPRWQLPYEGYSFELIPTADGILGQPFENVAMMVHAADGKARWVSSLHLLPELTPLPAGLAFFGEREDGRWAVGLQESGTGRVRWEHAWPMPEGPSKAVQVGDRITLLNDHGAVAFEAGSGRPLLVEKLADDETLVDIAGTGTQVLMLVRTSSGAELRRIELARVPPVALEALPRVVARPAWLEPGTILVYVAVLHKGIEPATGLQIEPQPLRFTVRIDAVEPDLRYSWKAADGRSGKRVLPASVLREALEHSDVYGSDEGEVVMDHTSIWVSRAVLAGLEGEGKLAWMDLSSMRPAALSRTGSAYHRVGLVQVEGTPSEPREGARRNVILPTLTAEGGYNTGRYWIAPYADYPLIVKAERGNFDVLLVHILKSPSAP